MFSTALATVSGSAVGATLRLAALVRGGAELVVMEVDPAADRALDDPHAQTLAALGEARLVGPAAAGVRHGPGTIGLVTALGAPARELWDALGDALGVGVDLGLAWDLSPGEALTALIAHASCDRVGLLLPDLARGGGVALGEGLRAAAGKVPVLVMTSLTQPGLPVLGALGAAVYDLRAGPALLLAALRLPPSTYPRGKRVAVISDTGPLGADAPSLLTAFGLELARPAEPTLTRLESELPLKTRFGGHLQIPGPTERHVTVARATLAADPGVDHVVTLGIASLAHDPLALLSAHGPLAVLAPLAQVAAARATPRTTAPGPRRASPPEVAISRAHAQVTAALIMRRRELVGDEASALLAALAPGLPVLPCIPVASLAAARAAARRIGYPVTLDRGAATIEDDDALTLRWEALLSELRSTLAPDDEAHDPRWDSRWMSRVAPTVVDFSARPLPSITVRHAGAAPRLFALPLAASELDPTGGRTFDATLVALEVIATHLPQITRATVRITEPTEPTQTAEVAEVRIELAAG